MADGIVDRHEEVHRDCTIRVVVRSAGEKFTEETTLEIPLSWGSVLIRSELKSTRVHDTAGLAANAGRTAAQTWLALNSQEFSR